MGKKVFKIKSKYLKKNVVPLKTIVNGALRCDDTQCVKKTPIAMYKL